MSSYSLATVDANLLVALHVLIEERSVSRAAEKMGLSQPAMSHALRRLRTVFHDELLVRKGRGMKPTPRAELLAAQLGSAVRSLDDVVGMAGSDPEMEQPSEYRIVASEYGELGAVIPALRWVVGGEGAPTISIQRAQAATPWATELREGRAHFAVGEFVGPAKGISILQGASERLSLVAPLKSSFRSLDSLESGDVISCVAVADAESGWLSSVRVAVAEREASMRCVLQAASYEAAARAVVECGLVGLLPERLARYFCQYMPIRPVDLGDLAARASLSVAWLEESPPPAHAWFVRLLERVLTATD